MDLNHPCSPGSSYDLSITRQLSPPMQHSRFVTILTLVSLSGKVPSDPHRREGKGRGKIWQLCSAGSLELLLA